MITAFLSLLQGISVKQEVFIMTKKLVVIAGIIGLATAAAAAVAWLLTRNKDIAECLDFDEDDEI